MRRSTGGAAFFVLACATYACSAPSGEAKMQSEPSTRADAGESATPHDPGEWGRADAASEQDGGARSDSGNGRHDASRGDDGTAYTIGATACGTGNACGVSAPVCCVDDNIGCNKIDERCSGFTMTCDGPEDCSMGEVCCATASKVACDSYGASHCPVGPGQNAAIACHTDADCTSGAPVCEREHMAKVDVRICHRSCTSADECKPWGMLYCYVAEGSTAASALCHSWPAAH